MQETRVPSLGQEDPLEKEMATYSIIPAWRIPWTEEPGRLLFIESQSRTWLKQLRMQHELGVWLDRLGSPKGASLHIPSDLSKWSGIARHSGDSCLTPPLICTDFSFYTRFLLHRNEAMISTDSKQHCQPSGNQQQCFTDVGAVLPWLVTPGWQ